MGRGKWYCQKLPPYQQDLQFFSVVLFLRTVNCKNNTKLFPLLSYSKEIVNKTNWYGLCFIFLRENRLGRATRSTRVTGSQFKWSSAAERAWMSSKHPPTPPFPSTLFLALKFFGLTTSLSRGSCGKESLLSK